jgi:hypothetical protein
MGNKVMVGQQGIRIIKTAWLLAVFMIVSWLGLYIHNMMEFPSFTLLSPENAGPALVSNVLFAGWLLLPYRRLLLFLIFGWTMIHFVIGAVLSVLPLPVWPFIPDQSLAHYMAHLIYAMFQLPLIVFLISLMTRKGE